MVVNLPNVLTISRLLLVPVFAYALLADNFSPRWVAAIAFGIAAITDWLDGFAARRLNQVTEFGKIVDPLVDRILIASTVLIFYVKVSDIIPFWAIAIVLSRDLIMVIGWLYMSRIGRRMQVIRSGKLTTTVLMVALFLVFANIQLGSSIVNTAGLWLFYTGVILSLVSGLNYLKLGTTILLSNQPKN
ncbi:MAG TPA: CDP-diacylglycerol--glycerol-3-phosphate 3-phosphatidyltransferase [Anaerolineae bacterium]|jgi:CDP-diacylglycerol--glycerol-3-phosphate 3-phosphatidyltransferase|nr:CDP-diacylglycerol--glycerol-3-phosphate 3-phosphatidyltransferase [Anaerolineae bacterium]